MVAGYQKKMILIPLWGQLRKSEWYQVVTLPSYCQERSMCFESHIHQITVEHITLGGNQYIYICMFSEAKRNKSYMSVFPNGKLLIFWVTQLVVIQMCIIGHWTTLSSRALYNTSSQLCTPTPTPFLTLLNTWRKGHSLRTADTCKSVIHKGKGI